MLKAGVSVLKASPIFPRIDVKKELKEIDEMMVARHNEKVKNEQKSANKSINEEKIIEIDISDFAKVQLKVAKVLTCEEVKGSKKLLKLSLSLGSETRQVVSGIKEYYKPEELIGKKVVLVCNLKPVKLCGVESQGMILCADDGKNVTIVTPSADLIEGSIVR